VIDLPSTCETIKYDETLKLLEDNQYCCDCRDKFYFMVKNGDVLSNFTLDRLDNTKGHTLENVRCMCLDCNRRLSDRELF
jgi:hypothetical protein